MLLGSLLAQAAVGISVFNEGYVPFDIRAIEANKKGDANSK